MRIDMEKIREDMKQDNLGAFFVGGFGGALVEAGDIERADEDELLRMARDKGIDVTSYER